jgi:hypothetical protein
MIERTDEANLKGVPQLRSLILIILAIIRGGAWECKMLREPFQNSHFFNFSLGIDILQTFIQEKVLTRL